MRFFVSYQTLDGAVAKAVADGIRAKRPDADLFFTAEILTLMQNEPDKALALIGNSGVGKSSLAQPGVIAALKRQRARG